MTLVEARVFESLEGAEDLPESPQGALLVSRRSRAATACQVA